MPATAVAAIIISVIIAVLSFLFDSVSAAMVIATLSLTITIVHAALAWFDRFSAPKFYFIQRASGVLVIAVNKSTRPITIRGFAMFKEGIRVYEKTAWIGGADAMSGRVIKPTDFIGEYIEGKKTRLFVLNSDFSMGKNHTCACPDEMHFVTFERPFCLGGGFPFFRWQSRFEAEDCNKRGNYAGKRSGKYSEKRPGGGNDNEGLGARAVAIVEADEKHSQNDDAKKGDHESYHESV